MSGPNSNFLPFTFICYTLFIHFSSPETLFCVPERLNEIVLCCVLWDRGSVPVIRPSKCGLVATLRPGWGIRKQEMLVKQEWMCLRTFCSSSCWFSEICSANTTTCVKSPQLGLVRRSTAQQRKRTCDWKWIEFQPQTDLQSLLQELHASLLSVGKLVRKAPVSNEENHGLREKKVPCDCC